MKKLLLVLLPIAFVSCENEYHVNAQVTFQNGQKDTIQYTYWSLQEQQAYIDGGDVGIWRNGIFASGARSFKLLKP